MERLTVCITIGYYYLPPTAHTDLCSLLISGASALRGSSAVQLPTRTEIDLLDFLVSAKRAFKEHLELACSVEYMKFLFASSDDAEREHESTANAIKALCTPEYYQKLEHDRRLLTMSKGVKRDYQVAFSNAFIQGAGYRPRTEVFREDDWSAPDKVTVEHMDIYVNMHTTETHRN